MEDGSNPYILICFLVVLCIAELVALIIYYRRSKQENVTEEDVISLVNEGHEDGNILASEAAMIQNIFEFSDTDVKDIMTHRKNIVAIDGIAVITEKNNSVTDISAEALSKIYTGEITNWSDLGGADMPIVVIGREAGSGTRDAFEELLEIEDCCKYAQELDSTGAVLAKVASTPGAIGYVSLDVVDSSVIGLKLDGVEPSEEQILAGNYILQRPFVMATTGEISEQSEAVKAWFAYIGSDAGKEVIKKVGLIVPQ